MDAHKFRNNNRNTGQSGYDGSISYPTLGWKYTTNGSIYATPSLDCDGNIYIGSSDNFMYSLTPQGTLRFYYKTLDSILSSAAISTVKNAIFFGSDDTYIYSLYTTAQETTSDDKYLKWKFKTSAAVVASPALSQDEMIVYIPSTDNIFYALYTSNGTTVYTIETGGPIYSSPAVSSNQITTASNINTHSIYFGSTDGYVYSIRTGTASNNTGNNNTIVDNILWKKSINADLTAAYIGVYASPVLSLSEANLYILAYNQIPSSSSSSLKYGPYVYALRATDGVIDWSYLVYDETAQGPSIRTFISSSPAVDTYGNIFIVTDDMTLYALTSSGSLKWKVSIATSNSFNGNYGGSICLGNDQSMYVLTNVLYAFVNDIPTATKYNFLWRTVQINTILNNNNDIIHPSPIIGSVVSSVIFGTSDGSISSVVRGKIPSNNDSGPGYSIADIIFIMPLFLAGCFSVCWFVRFRILFYFRLRRMREERRLRRERGENVGDDAEFETEFVLLNLNGGVLPGAADGTGGRGGGTNGRRRSINYLSNNWKVCNHLPTDYENLCSICFAPLFAEELVVNTANAPSKNNTRISSSDGVKSDVERKVGISSDSCYYDLNQHQQSSSLPQSHVQNSHHSYSHERQLLSHQKDGSTSNSNEYTLSNSNTTDITINSNNVVYITTNTPAAVTVDNDVIPSESVVLPCGHIFHKVCISSWATSHSNCPLCRFKPTTNSISHDDIGNEEADSNNNGVSINTAAITSVNNTNPTPAERNTANATNTNTNVYSYNYRSIVPHGRF